MDWDQFLLDVIFSNPQFLLLTCLEPYQVIFHICHNIGLVFFLQKELLFSIDWGRLLQVEATFNLQLLSIRFF